jgi:predicted RNA-binding Zn-ribbon protein involved in translation (DUF1610 family)
MTCRTCGSTNVGARDYAGYRTCPGCGRDLLDSPTVIRVEQSRVTGRWYVTEDGSRVPAIGHQTEPLALVAAEQWRNDQCLGWTR